MILRNFLVTLRRFKLASLLNITGLSLAFASFVIIMIQVMYDLRYDAFYESSDRLYRVELKWGEDQYSGNISRPVGESIKEKVGSISGGGLLYGTGGNFYTQAQGKDNATECVLGTLDSSFLRIFEFKTISGEISKIDYLDNIIISESLAKRFFNTVNAAGEVLYKNEKPFNVVAVYKDFPQNSCMKENSIYQLPNPKDPFLTNHSEWSFTYIYELHPQARLDTTTSEILTALVETFGTDQMSFKRGDIRLSNLHDIHFTNDIDYDSFEKANKTTTYTLFAIAILIVVIAMINFVNFSTSLVPIRIRSINTQKVLGSSTAKLRLSMIFEAVGLSLIAFGVALLLIYLLGRTSFPSFLSASMALQDNWILISILGVISLSTGCLAGLYPAIYSTSFAPALVLKGSFGLSPKGRALRSSLIGFQYVVSFVLIVAAIFVREQNDFMKSHDMGFQRENMLNVWVPNQVAKNPQAFKNKLLENTAIKGVAFADGPLVSNGKMGWGREFKGKTITYDCFPVSVEILDLLELKIVDGRNFMAEDSLKIEGTFIFNEVAAKKFNIVVGDKLGGHSDTPAEVVGIVRNFNFQPMQYGIRPLALYVMGSRPWRYQRMAFISVHGDVMAAKEYIEKTLREVAPDTKEISVTFVDDTIGQLYAKEDSLASLISIFSLLAISISIIGVFGMVMFDTQYRRKEIAVRKVHGSTIGQILMMFARSYIRIVLICFVVSVPIGYYIMYRWVQNFEYQCSIEWWIFAVSLVVVLFITISTITFQCLKAAMTNPVKYLKSE